MIPALTFAAVLLSQAAAPAAPAVEPPKPISAVYCLYTASYPLTCIRCNTDTNVPVRCPDLAQPAMCVANGIVLPCPPAEPPKIEPKK